MSISVPATAQFLRYDGGVGKWTNAAAQIADVSGLQAALDAKVSPSDLSAYVTNDSLSDTLMAYPTESAVETMLGGYSLTSHNHDGIYQPVGSYSTTGHTHDDRYFTEAEVTAALATLGSLKLNVASPSFTGTLGGPTATFSGEVSTGELNATNLSLSGGISMGGGGITDCGTIDTYGAPISAGTIYANSIECYEDLYAYGTAHGTFDGPLTTGRTTFENSTAPATPTNAVHVYAESNRLKAKFPSGRVAHLGEWSQAMPYAKAITATSGSPMQLLQSFTIPAGTYAVGDVIEICFCSSYMSAIFAAQLRVNGSAWGGNGTGGTMSGMSNCKWVIASQDVGGSLVGVYVRTPYDGAYVDMAQVGFAAVASGAALTIDVGITPLTSGQTSTFWHCYARLIKQS